MGLKVLELFDNLQVKIHSDGTIETLDHVYKRSNGRVDNLKGKVLKPKKDKYGYNAVTLTKNGKRKTYLVHRLVAMAFIPNPENKSTVNHINGIKTDNRAENLEWATPKEQKAHSIQHGLCEANIKSLQLASKRQAIPIFIEGRLFESIRQASRLIGKSQAYVKKYGKVVLTNG